MCDVHIYNRTLSTDRLSLVLLLPSLPRFTRVFLVFVDLYHSLMKVRECFKVKTQLLIFYLPI